MSLSIISLNLLDVSAQKWRENTHTEGERRKLSASYAIDLRAYWSLKSNSKSSYNFPHNFLFSRDFITIFDFPHSFARRKKTFNVPVYFVLYSLRSNNSIFKTWCFAFFSEIEPIKHVVSYKSEKWEWEIRAKQVEWHGENVCDVGIFEVVVVVGYFFSFYFFALSNEWDRIECWKPRKNGVCGSQQRKENCHGV